MEGTLGGERVSAMPGLADVEQRSWQSFRGAALRLHGLLNKSLLDSHHLALIDVRLLDALKRAGGSARMRDVAEELTALPSRVTRQMHRLESQGLVRRSSSPDDRRGVLATITADGRAALEAAIATYSDGVRTNFLAPLSRAQVAAMGESCGRIEARLRSGATPPRGGRTENA